MRSLIPADLSVVICSLNGAAGVDRCLTALREQKDVELQIIVVDDGSIDETSDVARQHGVTVIRHEVNRGLAAARNTGIGAASAAIVAFLDDDCEPEPTWARELLDGYKDDVIGVGGDIIPCAKDGFMLGYLTRNNPLLPLESELAKSNKLTYRLYLYAVRQWSPQERHDKRAVYSLVGANMSFRRSALAEAGFDERFRFGSEDLDICLQLRGKFPGTRLVVCPDARVRHHFVSSLGDTLRRSRSYGRGGARMYHKWPSMQPTIFPGPFLILLLLIASLFIPELLVAAIILPHALYPYGLRLAVIKRNPACVLDAYVRLATEAAGNIGYLFGLWQFRNLTPAVADQTVPSHLPQASASAGVGT